ncbi:hypothetical protein CPAR01_00143 [Colletotrichum paranaense]|uniref:Uncharacterized protein n=1 Tax=Colletotrichum paranaense TaxID=1914294 RepID=A0ABQ9T310_9PEZI|nr:uncharacterized protein CPAR01_00143 [Colletotrichum paranaense]KAK1546176.1 hypothetical protein CPAR01_00143 [Colletotrichum paranaense]
MSFRSSLIISGSGGRVGDNGPIIAQPGTPQLKLLTQGYANDTPTDMAKLIARRGADLLAAYFKVVAAASNGKNALIDKNHHLAWVPALRSLFKEKRWAEFPDVKNHHVQAVMIAIGDARKLSIDKLAAIHATPKGGRYKTFLDLFDCFNVDRIGRKGSSSSLPAVPAAPAAPAQSAPTVPPAFQILANHLQSTADLIIQDAFAALQVSHQHIDQISNGLQTSADQLRAAVTKTIQDALDGFNAKDKVIETITQQTDQANKAAQMAQTEITALRAKYEKIKDEKKKLMEKNAEATAAALVPSLTDTITGAVTHAMAEMEAAEKHGSISGQEMLFAHILDDLNELEALRGGENVEWTANDLDDYKEMHNIPDF